MAPLPLRAHFMYGLWDDGEPPRAFRSTVAAWAAQGWETRLWRRAEIEGALRAHGDLVELCESFSRRVQVADVARYVIVRREGGFYFDGDCVPRSSSLLEAVRSAPAVEAWFFIEHVMPASWPAESVRNPIREGVPEHCERLANFAFGAAAGAEVLGDLLALVEARCRRHPRYDLDYDVLYKTGPDALTEVVQGARARVPAERLRVVDHRPYMVHAHAGTWRRKRDARR